MNKDLQQQLEILQTYYGSGCQNKFSKKSKIINKKLQKIQQVVQACLRPLHSLRPNLCYISDTQHNMMVLSNPDFNHDIILGQIPGSYVSDSHSVSKITYDQENNYFLIQMTMKQLENVPIDYIMELYKKFHVQNQPKAITLFQKVEQNEFFVKIDQIPYLYQDDWMNYFLENDNLPTFLQRIYNSEKKLIFENIYNDNYLKLAGILPSILIDAIMKTSQIPEISTLIDLELQNNIFEGFIDSHIKPTQKEYRALVMTYEGVKVGVIIKEIYFHTYCIQKDCDYYVRKITYQVTNPRAQEFIFDKMRITKNSMDYLRDNQTNLTNLRLNNQLLFETDSGMQAKYKLMKPCGYKFKHMNRL